MDLYGGCDYSSLIHGAQQKLLTSRPSERLKRSWCTTVQALGSGKFWRSCCRANMGVLLQRQWTFLGPCDVRGFQMASGTSGEANISNIGITVCYWIWPLSSLIYPLKMVVFQSRLSVYRKGKPKPPIHLNLTSTICVCECAASCPAALANRQGLCPGS